MKKPVFLSLFLMAATNFVWGQPDVSKKNFHLYLLTGQSNMAGRGRIENEDTIPHPRVWMLTKDNQWKIATEPLHFDKPEIVGVGPGLAFAKSMAETDTNIIIGLIPCAVGGSPISVWKLTGYYEPTKSYPYEDAIRRTKTARKAGRLKGILWQQGESDSDSVRAKVYGQELELLIKKFRKDLKNNRLPFVAGTIAEFYIPKHPFAKVVNEAIKQLPKKLKYTAFVSSSGLTHKGDEVHFDSPSARALGKRYALTFQKFNNQKP